MRINYQFFPDQNFLLMRFQGEFSLDAFKKSTIIVQKDKNWKNLKYFLLDLREVKAGKTNLILKELIEVRNISSSTAYRMAYVVEDPKILANLHLFIDYIKSRDYQYFSTLKSAIYHLGIAISVDEMEQRIHQLENTIK